MLFRTHHSASVTAAPCNVSIFIIIDDQIAGGYIHTGIGECSRETSSLSRLLEHVLYRNYSYMIGAGVPVAARYATKYQVTYEIVGYQPTPCEARVDEQAGS